MRLVTFLWALLFGVLYSNTFALDKGEQLQYVLTKTRTTSTSLTGSSIDITNALNLNFIIDPDTTFCGIKRVGRAWIEVRLHFYGESNQYRIGRRTFDGTVTVAVIGTTDDEEIWGISPYNDVDLQVFSDSTGEIRPEQVYVFDVTEHHPHHLPVGDVSNDLDVLILDTDLAGIQPDMIDSLVLTGKNGEVDLPSPEQSDWLIVCQNVRSFSARVEKQVD